MIVMMLSVCTVCTVCHVDKKNDMRVYIWNIPGKRIGRGEIEAEVGGIDMGVRSMTDIIIEKSNKKKKSAAK